MFRTAALLMSIIGFAIPAIAQDKEPGLPENTIDCKQFKKNGPQEWIEVGTAVFDLGKIKDIHLTNQPVTPRYYKFGGIDVYTVVEQKCEVLAIGPASNTAAQASIALEQSAAAPAAPVAPMQQDKNSSKSTATAAQPKPSEVVPVPEDKVAKNPPESVPCGDRKSIYVADSLTETAEGRALVEIVFKNTMTGDERGGSNSEFLIREYKNNELEWMYKGKTRHGRFIFTSITSRHRNTFGDFIRTSMPVDRQESVALVPGFVKPNRNGTGEAILYVSGLHALFASKDAARRFKFEGKPPSEFLPEAFYFDRCE